MLVSAKSKDCLTFDIVKTEGELLNNDHQFWKYRTKISTFKKSKDEDVYSIIVPNDKTFTVKIQRRA